MNPAWRFSIPRPFGVRNRPNSSGAAGNPSRRCLRASNSATGSSFLPAFLKCLCSVASKPAGHRWSTFWSRKASIRIFVSTRIQAIHQNGTVQTRLPCCHRAAISQRTTTVSRNKKCSIWPIRWRPPFHPWPLFLSGLQWIGLVQGLRGSLRGELVLSFKSSFYIVDKLLRIVEFPRNILPISREINRVIVLLL